MSLCVTINFIDNKINTLIKNIAWLCWDNQDNTEENFQTNSNEIKIQLLKTSIENINLCCLILEGNIL